MPNTRNSILRQQSRKEAWESASRKWDAGDNYFGDGGGYFSMEGVYGIYNGGNTAAADAKSKRVMVVVDETSRSKHAMMWALTHVANKCDFMTLLHVVSPHHRKEASLSPPPPPLVHSLASLCRACRPEVEVEALVIQGPMLATVLSQVKKLEVSVLVLGQKKYSPLISCLCGPSRSEAFVDECINGADCLTIGVRKQSKGVCGYLINTRWQKNFWLLA